MCRPGWKAILRSVTIAVCCLLLGTTASFGQGSSAAITGVVTDPTGAVIPDASVTITNQRTGVDFQLKTNNAGVYHLPALLPGLYTVRVEARGFKVHVHRDLELTVNQTLRIDVAMELGTEAQVVTVEAAAPLVNTEEGRLSALVSGTQVQNMPLNGRNIYQLMQLAPGAINSTGVNLEQDNGGSQTNVNGTRANFNGFLIDGVANKGLSGGSNAQPSPDFVQEFRIMTNNYSAEYGNSAGSITDVSIKSGTNEFHGSAYEYFRNDKLNARNFFDDQRQLWRQNQFGATFGGPIKKERLFFFGGYEGQRFRTQTPKLIEVETPGWATAVRTALPGSVASYLYGQFPFPGTPTEGFTTLQEMVEGTLFDDIGFAPEDLPGGSPFMAYTNPCFLLTNFGIGAEAFPGGPNWGNAQATANRFAAILGVDAAENAAIQADIAANPDCAGLVSPGVTAGAFPRDGFVKGLIRANAATRTSGVFYNGDMFTIRGDYQGEKTRVFARYLDLFYDDPNVTALDSQFRGFTVPGDFRFPNAAAGVVYNISPATVNEFRAGYTRNRISNIPDPSQFGVPQISFDFGETGFGAYNGYPQFFTENVFHFSDMVATVRGKHSLKFGGEFRRNQENSEFNVGRPSYYFFDYLYFAADLPYVQAAGVNPELVTGGSAHIDTNIRAWRNYELGFFVQDDWKVTKNLTFNLGLRWDFYSPHVEKYGKMTRFIVPSGGLPAVNCAAQVGGNCVEPVTALGNTPNGGFAVADELFAPDKNNFSPRFGFAWDPFGTGKTSIRGGFAVFYQTTFWNSLSNSRWNLPFYSFNIAMPIFGFPGLPTYGPTNPDGTPSGAQPTHTGAPANAGQGPEGLGFAGNIMGWLPSNPNLAFLTGIPDPDGLRSPYVENGFLGIQHELFPNTVLEVNWVGTFGKKLYWAENPNRVVNGRARGPIANPCDPAAPPAATPLANRCFGVLRTWKNSVTSNYNSLQVQLIRRMHRGLAFTTAYTWAHWLDYRSTWHALTTSAAATEFNGFGASGYSLDPTNLALEYGNSSFDIRQRLTSSIVWELPWLKEQHGVAGKIFGGWQTNYLVSYQTGFPFTLGARRDFNGDGFRNDRPDTPVFGNSYPFRNGDFLLGSGPDGGSLMQSLFSQVPTPAPGTNGNLGRNTYRGPDQFTVDFSLFKTIPLRGETTNLQFRAEFYNVFNRVNLLPPIARLDSGVFGIATEAFDPRVIQFGLRVQF